jgi:aldehyde:ferredoxin oxidoreductase
MEKILYRLLDIDLTARKAEFSPIPDKWVQEYLGGRGLNSRILFERVRKGTDPYGPENVIVVGAGLLTGTAIPASSRFTVSAKSPLTGGLGDANSGGFFGPEMKFAGISNIVIRGIAQEPVYLFIDDDRVEFRDARHIWGKNVRESDAVIKKELGTDEVQILLIGPAGENLSPIASIMNNLSRAAARGGVAAVMGGKKLKAIAIRGRQGTKVKNRERMLSLLREIREALLGDPWFHMFSKAGTTGLTENYNGLGVMPIRNFQEGYLSSIESLAAQEFMKNFAKKRKGCFNCPIQCSHYYHAGGDFQEEGLEYESIAALGPRLGNYDFRTILQANVLCNRLGLDTIGAGDAIGFLMECYQRGLVKRSEADGLDLSWGNSDSILMLIRKMATRQGIGNLLAEGAAKAAKKIGPEAEKLAMHVKGQAIIAADPRGLKAWGLGYAVSSRGACHLRALPIAEYSVTPEVAKKLWGNENAADRFATKGKGKLVKWYEDVRVLSDALGLCRFITRTTFLFPEQLAKLLPYVTDLDLTGEGLFQIGERINNLERLFNVREGFSRKDDTLPDRFIKEPLPDGPSKGSTVDLDSMLDEYYEARGWDVRTGYPQEKKLISLGLTKEMGFLDLYLEITRRSYGAD